MKKTIFKNGDIVKYIGPDGQSIASGEIQKIHQAGKESSQITTKTGFTGVLNTFLKVIKRV